MGIKNGRYEGSPEVESKDLDLLVISQAEIHAGLMAEHRIWALFQVS